MSSDAVLQKSQRTNTKNQQMGGCWEQGLHEAFGISCLGDRGGRANLKGKRSG